tara:strand:- start:1555 stop:3006 length:1452 start_codon:yes stop_codon:yes gene_type:complete
MIDIKNKFLKIDNDVLVLFFGRALQALLSLIALRAITTFLEPDEVGNYYLILSIIFFFSYIALNPVAMYFNRHLLVWRDQSKLLEILTLFVFFILIVALISAFLITFIFYYLGYNEKFIYFEFLFLVVSSIIFSTLHRNILNGINIFENRKEFVLLTITTLTLGLVLSISIIIFYKANATAWFFGVILSEILILYFSLKKFISPFYRSISNFYPKYKSISINEILNFCVPIFLTNIMLWVQLYLYRVIVDSKYDSIILAEIGVALSIPIAIFALAESVIMQYYYPIYLKKIKNKDHHQRSNAWKELVSNIIPIYFFICLFVFVNSKGLLIILTSDNFHHVYVLSSIAILIELFRVLSNLMNQFLQAEYKTEVAIKPYFFGAVYVVLSLFILDFSEFKEGIIISLVVGNALTFFLMYRKISSIINMQDLHNKQNYQGMIIYSIPFLLAILLGYEADSILGILSFFGFYAIYMIYVIYSLNTRNY